jgi:hypothetical protein
MLLRQIIEGKIRGRYKLQEDDEEDVSSYFKRKKGYSK